MEIGPFSRLLKNSKEIEQSKANVLSSLMIVQNVIIIQNVFIELFINILHRHLNTEINQCRNVLCESRNVKILSTNDGKKNKTKKKNKLFSTLLHRSFNNVIQAYTSLTAKKREYRKSLSITVYKLWLCRCISHLEPHRSCSVVCM